jgi:hypothetical protein
MTTATSILRVVGLGPGLVAEKMVGSASAAATMASIEAFTPAMVGENFWVPFLSPPSKMLAPKTRSTLPMMEPIIEALTTVVRPAERAKIVMMSSAALPKVALRMPPTLGPACSPRDSVAWPNTQASPIRASEETAKIKSMFACKSSVTTTAAVSNTVAP